MERKTVGELSQELLLRPDTKQGVIDTQREMNKQIIPEIEKCIKNHKSWDDPYYIVILTKRERLLVNVIRQYFVARRSLPTPDLDQTVFKYTPKTGDLEYLWTVPDSTTVNMLVWSGMEIPEEQRDLYEFAYLFEHGQLDIVKGR